MNAEVVQLVRTLQILRVALVHFLDSPPRRPNPPWYQADDYIEPSGEWKRLDLLPANRRTPLEQKQWQEGHPDPHLRSNPYDIHRSSLDWDPVLLPGRTEPAPGVAPEVERYLYLEDEWADNIITIGRVMTSWENSNESSTGSAENVDVPTARTTKSDDSTRN